MLIPRKSLTESEEQVMLVLWKLGKGFLKEIVDSTPTPKAHPNTIATILKILVRKGFVEYTVHGRNNLYKPVIGRLDYGKRTANLLVKVYFEGSLARLLYCFINDHKLSFEELEQLLRQIQLTKNNKP